MNPGYIAFIVIYCLTLCLYFVTETTGKLKYRAPNKIALAIMFTVFAFVGFFNNSNYNIATFQSLLLMGIVLSALGDVFLLFSMKSGLDFFFAGNITLVMYELILLTSGYNCTFANLWWIPVAVMALVGVMIFLAQKFPNFFKFGKVKWLCMFYFLSISLQGMCGIAVMIFAPKFLLLGLGSFLFFLSDVVITFHLFVVPDNKWVLRLNSLLYFVGLLLIVLSTVVLL